MNVQSSDSGDDSAEGRRDYRQVVCAGLQAQLPRTGTLSGCAATHAEAAIAIAISLPTNPANFLEPRFGPPRALVRVRELPGPSSEIML